MVQKWLLEVGYIDNLFLLMIIFRFPAMYLLYADATMFMQMAMIVQFPIKCLNNR